MKIITRKGYILEAVENCLAQKMLDEKVHVLHNELLCHKVKFPLLEYATELLYTHLPAEEHLLLTDAIEKLKTEGGNVMLGYMLRLRLADYLEESVNKATAYIASGNEWYVADIIGERVFGRALLYHFAKALPLITKLAKNESAWVVRSIGAGAHYAIKKGLPQTETKQVFGVLLSLAQAKDHHIKRGIGWAAKTTATFHPDLIAVFAAELESQHVGQWFKTKVKIGLERNKYAARGRS